MDIPRSRLTADSDGRPRLIHRLGLKSRPLPYMEEHVLLEGQGWSPDPPYLSVHSPQSGLKICWSNTKSVSLCLAKHILQNLIKIKWKNIWIQEEIVSSMGRGKQSYLMLRLTITLYSPQLHLHFI